MSDPLYTDFLIVGAGPAGASLACFLGRYGHKGIMISSAPSTADTPRAHINNMAALECLRDIGLYEQCFHLGHKAEAIKHYRWCETLAGEEYARNYSWGNGLRRGDYEEISPCTHLDLPQNLLEPVLVRYATQNGFSLRFDTEFLELESSDSETGNVCKVLDRVANSTHRIRAKYLFGCDGGRSTIVSQLNLPMTQLPGGGLAFNILVHAELGHILKSRPGNLHWTLRIQEDYPFIGIARMVKPWYEWMFVFFPKGPDAPNPERSAKEWEEIVRDLIGEGEKGGKVEVLGISKWLINETYADEISKGNVFCLGDAIHRHPPTAGLGSNTCIQDAFNLSWKLHAVEKWGASPSLLSTYNTERQPVAQQLVTAANHILRQHAVLWQALGSSPYGTGETERVHGLKELQENSSAGRERRQRLKKQVDWMQHETHALGLEFGQLYKSTAIYAADELEPFVPSDREQEDNWLYYDACTYPGRRLPHVWLGTAGATNQVSTVDLAGNGRFIVFTGIGGDGWREAAVEVSKTLGVDIGVVGIGHGLEWRDLYRDWEDKRGIEEDGCLLVRPDYFVGWRADHGSGDVMECRARLEKALRFILGLNRAGEQNGVSVRTNSTT